MWSENAVSALRLAAAMGFQPGWCFTPSLGTNTFQYFQTPNLVMAQTVLAAHEELNDAGLMREEQQMLPPDRPGTHIATLSSQATRPLRPCCGRDLILPEGRRVEPELLSLAEIAGTKSDPQIAESLAIRTENSYGELLRNPPRTSAAAGV